MRETDERLAVRMGPLETFEALLGQHLRAVYETAAASPPGGGPAWDALLAHYGVHGVGPQERAMVVQAMGLVRGPTPGEVRIVFDAVGRWAQAELGRLAADPAVSAQPRAAWLAQQLTTLAQVQTEQYERSVVPRAPPIAAPPVVAPAAPALASIFANAQQTSKQVPWANATYDQVATLTCMHCGGPQEKPQDFMCRYCRRPIAGKLEPTS